MTTAPAIEKTTAIVYLFLFALVCFYIVQIDAGVHSYTVLVGALSAFCAIRALVEKYKKEYIHIIKLIWFVCISCIEYNFLSSATWRPVFFGGITNDNLFIRGEHVVLQSFYEIQLAYHLHSLIFAYADGAKIEMHVHHFVTVLLIVISNLTGLRPIGVYIFFLHDVPDITTGFVKFFHNTKMVVPLLTVYLLHLCSWAYFRLYLLAQVPRF